MNTIKFETINGQLCRMVEQPCPHCSQPEIIATPVVDGSAEWALYQMMQGRWVINPSLEQHKTDRNDTRYLHAYGKFGQDIVVKNIITGNDSILGAANIGHWTNYAEPIGWQIHEPEPGFKVGDWVEWCGDQYMVEYAPPQSGEHYGIGSPYDELGCSVYPENITRKLDPSDVIVRIGCLSGTVEFSWKRAGFFLITKHGRCWILLDALDAPTRELVEALLKAQEEK